MLFTFHGRRMIRFACRPIIVNGLALRLQVGLSGLSVLALWGPPD